MFALKYYGMDWLAMVLTFFALWHIGNKNKIGFVIMMGGNICWISIGVLTQSLAMVLANAVFFTMNLRALWKWQRPVKPTRVTPAAVREVCEISRQ